MVTYLFLLSWRATIIVAIAIPASLIATFFALYVFDFTLNNLTLLALTVAIGLLVDDAIVVVESVQKELDKGEPAAKAASIGTRKVWLAVTAGTAATLAVFLPIAFMSGIVGRFFMQYGLAIVFSVSVSLLIALTLTPMLTSRFLKPNKIQGGILGKIDVFHHRLNTAYATALESGIKYRYLVVLFAFLTFVGGMMLASQIPKGFVSQSDRSEFIGQVELPLGSGIEVVKAAAQTLNKALHTVNYVKYVLVSAGGGTQQKINLLDFYVSLTPKQERETGQNLLMDQARLAIAKAIPNAIKTSVSEVPWVSGGGVSNSKMEYIIQGSNLTQVNQYVESLVTEMRKLSVVTDVRTSYETGKPELRLEVNRRAAGELGISARTIGQDSQLMIGGYDVGTYEDGGRRYDIRARLKADQRDDLQDLKLIQFRASNGHLVDTDVVADLIYDVGPSQIDRVNRQRKISLYANPAPGVSLGTATQAFDRIIAENPLPEGLELIIEGEVRRMQETIEAISFVFVLAIIALYMVLAMQFDSFGQPIIVMLTAPLCFSGAFAGLYLADQELSLFSQIAAYLTIGNIEKILLIRDSSSILYFRLEESVIFSFQYSSVNHFLIVKNWLN